MRSTTDSPRLLRYHPMVRSLCLDTRYKARRFGSALGVSGLSRYSHLWSRKRHLNGLAMMDCPRLNLQGKAQLCHPCSIWGRIWRPPGAQNFLDLVRAFARGFSVPCGRASLGAGFCRFCHAVRRDQSEKSTNQPLLRIAFICVVTERQNRQNVPTRPETTHPSHCSSDRIDRTGLPHGWVHEERV